MSNKKGTAPEPSIKDIFQGRTLTNIQKDKASSTGNRVGNNATQDSIIDTNKSKVKCQGEDSKVLTREDLHPLLIGDFKPDVRPFKWPRRPKKKPVSEYQPGLFDSMEEK